MGNTVHWHSDKSSSSYTQTKKCQAVTKIISKWTERDECLCLKAKAISIAWPGLYIFAFMYSM